MFHSRWLEDVVRVSEEVIIKDLTEFVQPFFCDNLF